MVRDRKMKGINCPRCPVIFVRVHHGMKRVGMEPRLNERMVISLRRGKVRGGFESG